MRILMLNSNTRGIGTYQRCFYFSRELARSGHRVTMATVSANSKYKPLVYYKRDWVERHEQPSGPGPWVRMMEGPNLGYKWLPGWGSGPLDIGCRLREIFCDYEVVYAFEYQPNVSWPVYASIGLRAYRFLSDWCDWHAGNSNRLRGWAWAHKVDAFLEERIRLLARKVTVISSTLARRAQSLGIPANRIELVRQGVDTEYCCELPREQTRLLLHLPLDRPTLVSTNDGDMRRYVRIFAHILRCCPDAVWIAIGSAQQPALELAEALGVAGSIHWAGRVSDADYPRYIACADLCWLPLSDDLNNQSRFPAKVLDFLACGRPVVTSDVGEVGPIFREHEVGRLAPQDDEGFAQATAALLNHPETCHSLGQNASVLMKEKFDWRLRSAQITAVVETAA